MVNAIAFIAHRSLLRCPSKPIALSIEAYCVFPYDKQFLLLFHDALME